MTDTFREMIQPHKFYKRIFTQRSLTIWLVTKERVGEGSERKRRNGTFTKLLQKKFSHAYVATKYGGGEEEERESIMEYDWCTRFATYVWIFFVKTMWM